MTRSRRRILLLLAASFSLSGFTMSSAASVSAGPQSAEICFLTLGLGCIAAAELCDASPLPQWVCDDAFHYCLNAAEGICFDQ